MGMLPFLGWPNEQASWIMTRGYEFLFTCFIYYDDTRTGQPFFIEAELDKIETFES